MASAILTGYGPSNLWQNLAFDGNEKKFEIWETKILGYMKLKKLKNVFVTEDEVTADQKETAFAELIQFLDERSLTLVLREANDDGRKAWKILKEHYASGSKPRIITLYTQLTTLQKSHSEIVTDYLLRAESITMSLRAAGEQVSDSLLVAMVLKGLPDEYKPFVAVTSQSDSVEDFQKFKSSLKNFEETENSRSKMTNSQQNSVMKTQIRNQWSNNNKEDQIVCYNCQMPGHKSNNCDQKKKSRYCKTCKTNSHWTHKCRKRNKDNLNKTSATASDNVPPEEHSFLFKVNAEGMSLNTSTETFLVDCGATTHIVNHDTNFIDYEASFNPSDHYVELADGSIKNNVAKKRGTVMTKLQTSDGTYVDVKLCNVLYVPSYPQNIFSVQVATKRGCNVIFL